MKKAARILCGLTIVGTLLLGSAATAQEVFGEKLGFVPVNNSIRENITGTGWVRATLTGMTLVVEGEFSNLSSRATAAHIHLGAPGQNGPVVLPLVLSGEREGTISGTFELTEAQLTELRATRLYVNVHSENSPGGEIRAWLVPARQ
jgi:hypothetical protein